MSPSAGGTGRVAAKFAARRTSLVVLGCLALVGLVVRLDPGAVGADPAGPPASAIISCNVGIAMDDGVTLYANIARPSARGHYPTLLTTTIYGKDSPLNPALSALAPGAFAPSSGKCSAGTADTANLASDGYNVVTLDARGTGRSQGTPDYFGPRSTKDLEDVLDWIQRQPWSNGRVGGTGCSALGVTSIETAIADQLRVAQGKPRAVDAVWADSALPNLLQNGFEGPGGASVTPVFAAVTALSTTGKLGSFHLGDRPLSQLPSYLVGGVDNFLVQSLVAAEAGTLHDDAAQEARNLENRASSIHVPVALSAGESDVSWIQFGQAFLFHDLTNSPKRVLLMSPGGHCATTQWDKLGFGSSKASVVKNWFDHYLKGVPNGIENIPDVDMFPSGGTSWSVRGADFPVADTHWTNYYLDRHGDGGVLRTGRLTTSRPGATGTDSVICCVPSVAALGQRAALRYASPAFSHATSIAGPITAQFQADFTGRQGAFNVNVLDVAPDGATTLVSDGQLLASDRAVDPARSVYAGSVLIRPYHPLTAAASKAVDGPAEYDISLLPTAYRFPAGHRLEVAVSFTADTITGHGLALPAPAGTVPITTPGDFILPPTTLASMLGETMKLNHGGSTASRISIPFVN